MLSKKEHSFYIRKIHKFLNQGHTITFKKMRKYVGSIDYETTGTSVELDHRFNFLSTLIHEILHDVHHDKNEKWILKHEELIMNKLTPRQARNITKKLITTVSVYNVISAKRYKKK